MPRHDALEEHTQITLAGERDADPDQLFSRCVICGVEVIVAYVIAARKAAEVCATFVAKNLTSGNAWCL